MATPRSWNAVGAHGMLPQALHDEVARFNSVGALNRFLAQRLAPAVRRAYDQRGLRSFRARHGRDPRTRRDVQEAIGRDPAYLAWSVLRRNTMELRQQAGRSMVLRQAGALAAEARRWNDGAATLALDARTPAPRYLQQLDPHLMPGGYHTELFEEDVSAAANYDAGLFATLGGSAGAYSDAAGRALVEWLKREHPRFEPRRILDLGCGLGHNTLPVARAFPQAEVVAVDVASPMLRYGHARARSLGFTNVLFAQADGTATGFESRSFDLVYSTMLLHETSREAVSKLFAEARRLLRLHGVTVHLEQPPYRGLEPFEQFMRDWDGRYNNEPFWSGLHQLDLGALLREAGFDADEVFETRVEAGSANGGNDAGARNEAEDYGRKPAWYAVGARSTRANGTGPRHDA
jgi:SAM-dependent methyltransferase